MRFNSYYLLLVQFNELSFFPGYYCIRPVKFSHHQKITETFQIDLSHKSKSSTSWQLVYKELGLFLDVTTRSKRSIQYQTCRNMDKAIYSLYRQHVFRGNVFDGRTWRKRCYADLYTSFPAGLEQIIKIGIHVRRIVYHCVFIVLCLNHGRIGTYELAQMHTRRSEERVVHSISPVHQKLQNGHDG